MGLDLIVESCAKAGHEDEWRRLIERNFSGPDITDAEHDRFDEISIPPYERVGAPRVGTDAAADAWILGVRKAAAPEDVARVLKEYDGYYVLRLSESDGVPKYSHGGLYEGVDETSFRGSFLEQCGGVLSRDLVVTAWEDKFPEEAVAYGQALLAAAGEAAAGSGSVAAPEPKRGLFSRIGLSKPKPTLPLDEQLDIVRSAAKWYIFWGERGHAIRAWS